MNLRNIDNLNNKINMLKIDYNELKKKYIQNQNKINDYKLFLEENEELKNENKALLKENMQNKKIIEKLNKEIISLNEKIKIYIKEIEEIKNKKDKSLYEDEIVIINKECTFSKNDLGNEFNHTVKKQIGLTENDVYKYHDIISELNNLILIYEHFFFKKGIKSKIIMNYYDFY